MTGLTKGHLPEAIYFPPLSPYGSGRDIWDALKNDLSLNEGAWPDSTVRTGKPKKKRSGECHRTPGRSFEAFQKRVHPLLPSIFMALKDYEWTACLRKVLEKQKNAWLHFT